MAHSFADKVDFVRDVAAYMCAVAMVIGIAYDGTVHLFEALLFPAFYFAYIGLAVAIMYIRVRPLCTNVSTRRQ